jgi:hypothetical protein
MFSASIWNTVEEARAKSVSQEVFGSSSCGLAALASVFSALGVTFPMCGTEIPLLFRRRLCDCDADNSAAPCANNIPMERYCESRANAGTNPEVNVGAATRLSGGKIKGEILLCGPNPALPQFQNPESLGMWLKEQLDARKIPVVSMDCSQDTPSADYWHSQTVWAVSDTLTVAWVTNPVEPVLVADILKQMCSDTQQLHKSDIRLHKTGISDHCKHLNIDWNLTKQLADNGRFIRVPHFPGHVRLFSKTNVIPPQNKQ